MKKLLAVALVSGLSTFNVAHADGWHRGFWHRDGWREGWAVPALGAAIVGGVIGSALVQRPVVYAPPVTVVPQPVYVPAPVYAAPPMAYVQPAYPAPVYYYGR